MQTKIKLSYRFEIGGRLLAPATPLRKSAFWLWSQPVQGYSSTQPTVIDPGNGIAAFGTPIGIAHQLTVVATCDII